MEIDVAAYVVRVCTYSEKHFICILAFYVRLCFFVRSIRSLAIWMASLIGASIFIYYLVKIEYAL